MRDVREWSGLRDGTAWKVVPSSNGATTFNSLVGVGAHGPRALGSRQLFQRLQPAHDPDDALMGLRPSGPTVSVGASRGQVACPHAASGHTSQAPASMATREGALARLIATAHGGQRALYRRLAAIEG